MVSSTYIFIDQTNPTSGNGIRVYIPYIILALTFSSVCISSVFIYRQIKMMIQVYLDSRGNKKI